jgi:hypothetical protein
VLPAIDGEADAVQHLGVAPDQARVPDLEERFQPL